MESDLPYYVALAAAPGICPIRFQLLIKYFKTAKAVWIASDKILEKALTPKLFQQFISIVDNGLARSVVEIQEPWADMKLLSESPK